MLVGGRTVVAVIDPEHGNSGLRRDGEMQDGGLVGAEVGGDNRAAGGLRDSPTRDLQGGFVARSGFQGGEGGGILVGGPPGRGGGGGPPQPLPPVFVRATQSANKSLRSARPAAARFSSGST